MRKVPVDIVSGFLGSGKTTLLAEALAGPLVGGRVAVVVNEIGEIGIDGAVLSGLEYVENMVELSSGCICCTIDEYRFAQAIAELVETVDPELIVIETTGLAEPSPTIERVHEAGLGLDAVITVVDAENLSVAARQSPTVRRQIQAADFLVVTKCDLVTDSKARSVMRTLGRWNRRAHRLVADRGRVSEDVLFSTSVRRARERAKENGARERAKAGGAHGSGAVDTVAGLGEDSVREHLSEMETFSWRGDRPMDRECFEHFLSVLPDAVYRAKGLIRLVDNDWSSLFNFTCGRYELGWVKLAAAQPSSQAVFIGRGLAAVRGRIECGLAACQAAPRT